MNLTIVLEKKDVLILIPILNGEIQNPLNPIVEVGTEDIVDTTETSLSITFEEPREPLTSYAALCMIQAICEAHLRSGRT
jgi:hypothetical protein